MSCSGSRYLSINKYTKLSVYFYLSSINMKISDLITSLFKEQFSRSDLEFELKFKKQINQASEEILVKFGLDICKRLLQEYVSFYNRHQWGDPSALELAINYCESHKRADMQNQILQDHWDRVSDVTPDTEDYGDYDGSYALNAGCAVMTLLSFLIDGSKDSIREISTYMTDTIDFKLYQENPNLTDKELEIHPDMIQERKYQLKLLS